MIKVKTHRSGKLNVANPSLVRWVLPIFLIGVFAMIAGMIEVISPVLALVGATAFVTLTGMGMAWPALSHKRVLRTAALMDRHKERYYLIDPAKFPGKSLSELLDEHDDKSGTLHMIAHPETHRTIEFIEFDNEQDRVMFRLAVP
jgi:hypothetical protein